ncbi:unnamed protein product [Nesidiocoris tenuis]|uniref:Uncharacterized protein n=1 Tax=Nesidiocoris tenuis TaxID=355587 RepID=A0A6H5GRU3_9HEMI|nr:unnamed protein product [Nesidiocoris tenuis]
MSLTSTPLSTIDDEANGNVLIEVEPDLLDPFDSSPSKTNGGNFLPPSPQQRISGSSTESFPTPDPKKRNTQELDSE